LLVEEAKAVREALTVLTKSKAYGSNGRFADLETAPTRFSVRDAVVRKLKQQGPLTAIQLRELLAAGGYSLAESTPSSILSILKNDGLAKHLKNGGAYKLTARGKQIAASV